MDRRRVGARLEDSRCAAMSDDTRPQGRRRIDVELRLRKRWRPMGPASESGTGGWLNAPWRHAVVCVVFLALTAVMVWPVTTLPRIGVGSYGGDALLNAWALAW